MLTTVFRRTVNDQMTNEFITTAERTANTKQVLHLRGRNTMLEKPVD
jgi:hypothetical protein